MTAKEHFEKELLKLGYESSGESFTRYFGKCYQLEILVYDGCDKRGNLWVMNGWGKLIPHVECDLNFERKGKSYNIKAVKKVEVEFAKYVQKKVIPQLKKSEQMPEGLAALL